MNIPQTTSSQNGVKIQLSKIYPLKKGCRCFTWKSQVITSWNRFRIPRKPLSGKVPFPPSRNDGRSQSHPRIQGFLQGKCRNLRTSGWWLNQPLKKICSSNWTSSPGIGVNIKKYLSCHHLLDIPGSLRISMFSHVFFWNWLKGVQLNTTQASTLSFPDFKDILGIRGFRPNRLATPHGSGCCKTKQIKKTNPWKSRYKLREKLKVTVVVIKTNQAQISRGFKPSEQNPNDPYFGRFDP